MALTVSRFAWTSSGLLLSTVLMLPLVAVILAALPGGDPLWQHVYQTLFDEYLVNSFRLVTAVALLVLLIGVPTAWLITMYRFPGHRLLGVLLVMPLAIPAYILAYIYSDIFAVPGFLQQLFGEQLPQIRSLPGAVVVLAIALYPYMYLMCRAAFIDQPNCITEAARVLGCNRWHAFWRVSMPMARPAVAAALALVVMETLADYGVAQYYGVPVFTTGIFRAWSGFDSAVVACRLAVILLLFSGVLLLLERFARRRARYHNPTNRRLPLTVVHLRGGKAVAAVVICSIPVLVGFIIPLGFLLYSAVISSAIQVTADFIELLWQSFSLAAVTAVIALAVALFLQAGVKIHGGKIMNIFIFVVRLGYGVPGVVVAVGLLVSLLWLQQLFIIFGIDHSLVVGTLAGLVFAYLVRFVIMPLQSLENGLGRIKPSLSEVVRSMGFSNTTLVRRVYMPIMHGSIWVGLLIVFVEVVKELPATLLLRPFNFNTLAVRTYELANDERLAEAAWPALAIVLVCMFPVWLLSSRIEGSGGSREVVIRHAQA